MKEKRLWRWKIACLLLAALCIALIAHIDGQQGSLYTVRMHLGGNVFRDGLKSSIVPKEEADFSSGSHDAKPERVRFDGAEVRCASGYGPCTLSGAFSAEDVNAMYGQQVLTEDWSFGISAFKTGDNVGMDFYLSIDLPEQPDGEVTATLLVLYDGYPAPATFTWTGGVGEHIGFGIEL